MRGNNKNPQRNYKKKIKAIILTVSKPEKIHQFSNNLTLMDESPKLKFLIYLYKMVVKDFF